MNDISKFKLEIDRNPKVNFQTNRGKLLNPTGKLLQPHESNCNDDCKITVLLVNENPFNLIPLEGMINGNLGLH